MKRILNLSLALVVAVLSAAAPAADKYPAHALSMEVPWGPGGGADTLGRMVAQWLSTDLKAAMPVNNVPGAGGIIGLGRLVRAPAEGYSLGVLTSDTVLMAVLEPDKLKLTDMTVLAVMSRQPSGFFVRTDSRFATWADVVAAAKTRAVSVATTGPNSPDDIAVATVDAKGVHMVPVAYAKPGERYASVLAGHVELLFEQGGDVRSFLEAKKLRPLLFFSNQRLGAPFADVPVSSELGYDAVPPQVRAIVVRSGTDPEAMAVLSKSIAKFAASSTYADYLRDQLAAPDSFMPTSAGSALIARDIETLKRMVANLPPGSQAIGSK